MLDPFPKWPFPFYAPIDKSFDSFTLKITFSNFNHSSWCLIALSHSGFNLNFLYGT